MGEEDADSVCVCLSIYVLPRLGHLYHFHFLCRPMKMEENHYITGKYAQTRLAIQFHVFCLWSLIEIWICSHMLPVTLTFDFSLHELIHWLQSGASVTHCFQENSDKLLP